MKLHQQIGLVFPNLDLNVKVSNFLLLTICPWVAAIAPWFRLRLPSCDPGFKSQAHHLRFFQFVLKL